MTSPMKISLIIIGTFIILSSLVYIKVLDGSLSICGINFVLTNVPIKCDKTLIYPNEIVVPNLDTISIENDEIISLNGDCKWAKGGQNPFNATSTLLVFDNTKGWLFCKLKNQN